MFLSSADPQLPLNPHLHCEGGQHQRLLRGVEISTEALFLNSLPIFSLFVSFPFWNSKRPLFIDTNAPLE